MVRTIYWQDIFLFTYEVWKSADVNTDFPDPRYNVNNFMSGATVVVEFQIMLCKLKTCNKVDIIKTYLFRLLGIYLVDDPMQSIILIPDKYQYRKDKWIVTLPCTKRTKTSINPLES